MLSAISPLVSQRVRERIMRHYGVPYSCTGLAPGLVAHLPQNKPVSLVDVGASTGEFTDTIRRYCGLRRAILIEPQPELAAALTSRFQAARVEQCALSDCAGKMQMDILNFHYASSLLPLLRTEPERYQAIDLDVHETITVSVRTLDSVMEDEPGPIDLLKLDVQGNELAVCCGARETLARTGLIWTEVSFRPLYSGSTLFHELHAFLYDAGFMLTWIEHGFRGANGELLQGDALFRRR